MSVIPLDRFQTPRRSAASAVPGFDVLRAIAALGVVVLHAGVPYLRHPMPGLIWPVSDSSSTTVDAVFWGIEVLIMPLFLVMAGFLLWRSMQRNPPGKLVRSRAKRLLIPLAFGVFALLPFDIYIWTMGFVVDGLVPAAKLKSLKFDPPISEQIWGLSHLWFLLYVFLYVAVAALLLRVATKSARVQRCLRLISEPKRILVLLSVVAIATLMVSPEVVWGFQHAFLPVPSKWIYSGMFFAAGCALAWHDPTLERIAKQWWRLTCLSLPLLFCAVTLGLWSLEQRPSTDQNHLARFMLAFLTVAAAGFTTAAALACAAKHVKTVPAMVRYLAAASFWIYLVHHPILGLVHIDLKWLWPNGAPVIKLCVSFLIATAVALLMYESFIRRSRLGKLLGFAYQTPAEANAAPDKEASHMQFPTTRSPERRAA